MRSCRRASTRNTSPWCSPARAWRSVPPARPWALVRWSRSPPWRTSATAFGAFESYVERDKRLGLEAMREAEYYEKQSEMTAKLVGVIGFIIAFCFGVGAILSAMITMHASIGDRRREIGTLRALGFS